MHHERVMRENIMEEAPADPDIRSEWTEGTRREREARRSEEWIGEGSGGAKRIVERTCKAKKRVEEFKRVCKSEDIGVERVVSGVVLGVAGWIFDRGRPGAMAVVGLAFLRVNQDLISVVDLMLTQFTVHCVGRRRHSPDETSPLPESCLKLERDRGASEVPVSCMLFGLKTRL
jgi:hypothetical protein